MRIYEVLSLLIFIAAAPALAQASDPNRQSLGRENFAQADADGDERLSASEFRRFIDENAKDDLGRAARVKRFGVYEKVFARLDANKDGFVTRAEIAIASRD
jgi:Ca2+-binding EF-hand superfamily protein